jgi:hypothetical protein
MNIGTQEDPNILKIGTQCLDKEKHKFTDLLCEFKYVFAWSYEDLRGFDPNIIQLVIPIKEEAKLVRKR